jgi:hypothetical protein
MSLGCLTLAAAAFAACEQPDRDPAFARGVEACLETQSPDGTERFSALADGELVVLAGTAVPVESVGPGDSLFRACVGDAAGSDPAFVEVEDADGQSWRFGVRVFDGSTRPLALPAPVEPGEPVEIAFQGDHASPHGEVRAVVTSGGRLRLAAEVAHAEASKFREADLPFRVALGGEHGPTIHSDCGAGPKRELVFSADDTVAVREGEAGLLSADDQALQVYPLFGWSSVVSSDCDSDSPSAFMEWVVRGR